MTTSFIWSCTHTCKYHKGCLRRGNLSTLVVPSVRLLLRPSEFTCRPSKWHCLILHPRRQLLCTSQSATEAPSQGTSEGSGILVSKQLPLGTVADDVTQRNGSGYGTPSPPPSSSADDDDDRDDMERAVGSSRGGVGEQGGRGPPGAGRMYNRRQRGRVTAEEVIGEFEDLLRRADEMKKTRRPFRRSMFDYKEIKAMEAFAIQNLHKFTLEDSLELFQVCAELEFSSDSALFTRLLPRLTNWLHKNHDQMEADTSMWTQILWLYRLSTTLHRVNDGLLGNAVAYLSTHMPSLSAPEVSIVMRCAAYVELHKTHTDLVNAVLARAIEVLDDLPAENAADLLWCMARMQYSKPETVEAVLHMLPEHVRELRPKYQANVCWACATLEVSHTPLNDALRDAVATQPGAYRAKQLSNFVWAWSKVGYHPVELVRDVILPQAELQRAHFAPQDWDSLLYGLCKMKIDIPLDLLRHAGDSVLRRKGQVMGRTVGGILKTYGYVGFTEESYIAEMFEILKARVGSFGSYELSNVLVGLGHLGRATPELLVALERQALEELPRATVQGIANITWAFAKLEHRSDALLAEVARLSHERIGEMTVPDARDLLMSFAWLQYTLSPELAQDITGRICRLLSVSAEREGGYRLSARDFATLLWSLGKLGIVNSPLMNILRKQQPLLVGDMNSMDVANMTWAYVKLNYNVLRANFKPIAVRALELVDETAPSEMSTILMNMARLEQYPGDELMVAYERRAVENLDAFSGEALAYLVSAYSFYQYIPHALFDKVVERAVASPQDLSMEDWENILFSCSHLQYNTVPLLDVLDKQLWREGDEDPPLGLISLIMWAVAVGDLFPSTMYDKCLATLQKLTSFQDLEAAPLRRIYQAHVLACATNRSAPTDVSLGLRAAMASNVENTLPHHSGTESRLVNDICATLGRLGIRHKTNVPAKGNLFKVDIVLDRANEQVAIEALDRKDVSRNSATLMGHCLYRKHVLEAYGWKVLSVNFWEWERVLLDADAKEEIVLALMARHGLEGS